MNKSVNIFQFTSLIYNDAVFITSEQAMRSAAANSALHANAPVGRPRAGSFSKKGMDRGNSLRIDTSGQMNGGGSFRANNVTGTNVDQLRWDFIGLVLQRCADLCFILQ